MTTNVRIYVAVLDMAKWQIAHNSTDDMQTAEIIPFWSKISILLSFGTIKPNNDPKESEATKTNLTLQ